MLVRFCLFFMLGSLPGLKAQNTAAVQLNVRLEPVQLLSVQNSTGKAAASPHHLLVTSTYGYTVRLHRERMESVKKSPEVFTSSPNLLSQETNIEKIVSQSTGTQESLHSVYLDQHRKAVPETFNSTQAPLYVYTIVSH